MPAPPAEIAPPVAGNPAPALADCTPALDLSAAPRAMIAVTLTAPCAAGDRVVLRHAGLTVAERLDAQGKLVLDLPAFDPAGEVSVLFADATQLHSAVAVPDAAQVHRFAVQWMAEDSFQIRAVESGEAYGDASNVWAEAPVSAHGGYLMALGDPGLDLPMMAQVYTWPADPAISADPVVEAAVTDLTCGRELLGETIETAPAGPVVRDLTLAMPGCDALGDILVLNNLAGDVTLTAGN
ncbi:hypothetical protein, partial [Xinfangfangia pollutisoli]|uniref:hypothetical protein n=1 Tax=Xinfangfangia pollutisoli TaxID=2865960 RepID=UPI001CD36E19